MSVTEALPSQPVEVTDIVSCPSMARMVTAVAYATAYATDLPIGDITYMTGATDAGESTAGGIFWLGDKEVLVTILLDSNGASAGLSVEVDGDDVNWLPWLDPLLEEVTSAVVAAITNYINSLSNIGSIIGRVEFTPGRHMQGHASVALITFFRCHCDWR